jgi:hypothetical protein
MNSLELKYLATPHYYKSIVNPNNPDNQDNPDNQNNHETVNREDIKFYKKRIISLCKKMLKNEKPPTMEIKKIHDDYVNAIILYFKMQDTNDILQEQYKLKEEDENASIENAEPIEPIDAAAEFANANEKMLTKLSGIHNNNNNNNNNNLYKYVKIISNNNDTQKPKYILPVKKEIDLKNPSLKKKGIK